MNVIRINVPGACRVLANAVVVCIGAGIIAFKGEFLSGLAGCIQRIDFSRLCIANIMKYLYRCQCPYAIG